jgi:tetratricopeptide (TPR) repeat protein
VLDDSLAEPHAVMGFVNAHYEYDWPGAEREYRRGLELNPNDVYAHFFYSNSYLSPLGLRHEAVAEMEKAIALDPFSPPIRSFLGRTFLWARRYDEALEQFKKCTEMFPGFAIDRERLAHLYTYSGRFEEAITEETKALASRGRTQGCIEERGGAAKRFESGRAKGLLEKGPGVFANWRKPAGGVCRELWLRNCVRKVGGKGKGLGRIGKSA